MRKSNVFNNRNLNQYPTGLSLYLLGHLGKAVAEGIDD